MSDELREQESASSEDAESLRDRLEERAHEQTTVRGRSMDRATVLKFAGLVAFIAIMALATVCASTPCVASTTRTAHSHAARERETS